MRSGRGQGVAEAASGAWPDSFVATASSRRAIEDGAGAAAVTGWNELARREGRSTGHAEEALMAGSGHSDGIGSGRAQRAALPWPKQRSRVRGERRERKKERESEV